MKTFRTKRQDRVVGRVMTGHRKIFYGWWIVLASAIMLVFVGGTFYYGFTVFFNPIRNTFGWTAATTSVAFTLQRLELGILGPLVGFLVDRVGPRKLAFFGWLGIGLGFLAMSRTTSLGVFYATFLLVSLGASFASGLVTNTAIANWFNKKRSRALAVAFIGPGISGALAPLLAISIVQFGWRDTLVIVGIILLVVGPPLSLVLRHRPGQYGYLPDGETGTAAREPTSVPISLALHGITLASSDSVAPEFTTGEALKTRAFWLLAAVVFFQQTSQSALMVHVVPYLESVKVPTTIAATVVTGMTLVSLIGRIGFGFLGDFTNKRYLIAIGLALQTAGILIFSLITVDKTWLIIAFLLTYGPGYGGPIPLRPALQADYFGTKSFGMIMGLWALISMVGGLASPIVAGWLFDTTASYRLAWQIFALVTLPAIPLILIAKPPRAKPENHLT